MWLSWRTGPWQWRPRDSEPNPREHIGQDTEMGKNSLTTQYELLPQWSGQICNQGFGLYQQRQCILNKGGWRKRLTGLYRIGHPIYLVVKIPVVGIHMGHKCLYGFAYSKRSTYIPLPQISLSRIFNRVPPKSLIIQINYWPKSMNQYIIAHLDIYSSKQSAQSGTPPKDTLTGKIFLPHCPLEMSQRGAVVL